MWAGMYGLDLYCDNANGAKDSLDSALIDEHGHRYNEFPHQYTHELGSVCRAMARLAGWVVRKDGSAICPKCSGKRKPGESRLNDVSGTKE